MIGRKTQTEKCMYEKLHVRKNGWMKTVLDEEMMENEENGISGDADLITKQARVCKALLACVWITSVSKNTLR